jgi:hypothetical protein
VTAPPAAPAYDSLYDVPWSQHERAIDPQRTVYHVTYGDIGRAVAVVQLWVPDKSSLVDVYVLDDHHHLVLAGSIGPSWRSHDLVYDVTISRFELELVRSELGPHDAECCASIVRDERWHVDDDYHLIEDTAARTRRPAWEAAVLSRATRDLLAVWRGETAGSAIRGAAEIQLVSICNDAYDGNPAAAHYVPSGWSSQRQTLAAGDVARCDAQRGCCRVNPRSGPHLHEVCFDPLYRVKQVLAVNPDSCHG